MPSAARMAAAPPRLQAAAATEHSAVARRSSDLEVLPRQSTAPAVNVVFINIDWKAARHNRGRLKANMRSLNKTICGVVRHMKPAMICMCEVGVVKDPLTAEQMQQVQK